MTRKLKSYFKGLGVGLVLDSRFGGDIALLESAAEFVERFQQGSGLPMLASSCPGWVCYAEKKHGEFILP